MARVPRIVTLVSLAFLVAVLLAGPAQAQHPTAVTSIVNSESDTTLEVNHNGSLLAPGERVFDGTEADSIPATGFGTRLMWYPAKFAFRAGRLSSPDGGTGNEWDAENIGYGSVAFGVNTKAVGTRSAAFGFTATASGLQATAMGTSTVASGDNAVAMGDRSVASNFEATAMGRETEARGRRSTTMGFGTFAANETSVSIGECNNANSEGSSDNALFVIGNGTYRTEFSACEPNSDAFVVDDGGSATASSHDTFSDRRLKTTIRPMQKDILAVLSDIRPVRFRFKDESTRPSGEQIGLIAQEVQQHFPALVSKESSGYLSLAYPKFSAVLLKGLQEQQAQLEEKQTTIEKHEQRISDLEKRLAALEAERSGALPAGLVGPWALVLLVGLLGGLGAGLLWHRRA